MVYSTNPDFEFEEEQHEEQETKAPNQQLLYVSLDRKNRGGKEVSLVEGFIGLDDDLKDLAKILDESSKTIIPPFLVFMSIPPNSIFLRNL